MSLKTFATLGGIPLLNSSSVRWTLRTGVAPNIETYDIRKIDAEALRLRDAKAPITLAIGSGDVTLLVNFLYVIDVIPGDNPHIFRVRVADRRYWWSYGHTIRRYNIRRHVGFRGVLRNDQLGLQDVVPRVWYARYSLKEESDDPENDAWAVTEMIEDAIKEANFVEEKWAGTKIPIQIDEESIKRTLPVEGVTLDDKSNSAVARALSYAPEATLYVDPESGAIVVFGRADAKEKEVYAGILPEKVTDSHIDLVLNDNTRPNEIQVVFTPEIEVRFDFIEAASTVAVSTGAEDDRRTVENVLPSPDFTLDVVQGDAPTSYTVPQGTWITMDQAFRAYRAAPGGVPNGIVLDHDVVQKAFMPFMDLWAALDLVGSLEPDVDWSSRIAAVQANYRTTYRINRRWTDRSLSMRASRVSTTDQATGQRAPAPWYGNHCILSTQRSLFLDAIGDNDLTYATNFRVFDAPFALDDTVKPASADVQIVDMDQGIIHVNYKIDRYRVYEMILPSLIDEDTIPKGNVKQGLVAAGAHNILFNGVIEGQQPPRLESSYRAATILTLVPASPNDNRQLFAVTIKPEDIKDMIPAAAAEGLSRARGPRMTIRVGAGVETARVRWVDSHATAIENAFGIGLNALAELEIVPSIDDLITNLGDPADVPSQNGVTGGSLVAIAKAHAARVYASMIDRLEGSASGTINTAIRPRGWTESITWELMANGNFNTRLTLPDKIEEFDMLAFLDASTRAIVLRQAQPPGAA